MTSVSVTAAGHYLIAPLAQMPSTLPNS